MTVSSSYTEKVYQINGTSTTFTWGQEFDSQYGSLVVTEETSATSREVVTTYVEGTDYNIVGSDVVFVTAPSDTSHYIRIARNTYRGQPVVFNEGEDFPAEDYEHSLDRLAMSIQEQDKALQIEKAERQDADTTLQNNITAEENRAKGVEGNLSNLTTTSKTNLVSAINEVNAEVDSLGETISNYGNIVTHDVDEFATAAQGAKADTALQPDDLGNATLTIKKNSTAVGTFTANSKTDTDINLVIPTTAAEVNALPDSTKYAASISLSIDSTTYVLTVQLKDQNGSSLGTAATIDLPLESVIVSGSYDSTTKSIILVLDSGDTITIPVGDLVSGLQAEITSSNMLDADLVDDSTSTNKFVTALEKSTWSGKQDTIDSSHKLSADLVDDSTSTNKFVTATEKSAIDTALQPTDISDMQTKTNLVTSVSSLSTDSQYPSAKLFYDTCGDIETLINAL